MSNFPAIYENIENCADIGNIRPSLSLNQAFQDAACAMMFIKPPLKKVKRKLNLFDDKQKKEENQAC